MKRFIVCKVWVGALPSVVASFDSEKDAAAYAALSSLSDKSHDYAVLGVIGVAHKEG